MVQSRTCIRNCFISELKNLKNATKTNIRVLKDSVNSAELVWARTASLEKVSAKVFCTIGIFCEAIQIYTHKNEKSVLQTLNVRIYSPLFERCVCSGCCNYVLWSNSWRYNATNTVIHRSIAGAHSLRFYISISNIYSIKWITINHWDRHGSIWNTHHKKII